MAIVDCAHLEEVWKLLEQRNRELGFERYDFGDIQSNSVIYALSQYRYTQPLVKLLKVPEFISPVLWRRLLLVRKTIVPSVYYHLGLSYLDAETELSWANNKDADRICECAIQNSVQNVEHMCWMHPYKHHAGAWKNQHEGKKIPLSCAHHTARLGIMLLMVGIEHDNRRYIESGVSAANALVSYHNWQYISQDRCAVSYYPNTNDEVINTGADVAALFALVPDSKKTDAMKNRLECLVNMICSEQNEDGSWYYCTKNHYKRHSGVMYIDNHHTAMNISSLANILKLKVLDDEKNVSVVKTLEKGITYYLDNFFNVQGDGYYFPKGKRDAGVVGHSEGALALLQFIGAGKAINPVLRERANKMLPLILEKAITKYVNIKTGDVACYIYFGRRYQIASARWGSAPLMQAIIAYLKYQGKKSV